MSKFTAEKYQLVFHLEDINENMPGLYGNHNQAFY